MVREYFLKYNECMSNDFTLSRGGSKVELHSHDIDDWRITFVETGLHSNIGQRLVRVRKYLEGEPVFLANYSDGLSDLPLDRMLKAFEGEDWTASFAAVHLASSLHSVCTESSGVVTGIGPLSEGSTRINGGYFILRQEIFDSIQDGEELVEQPFQRLIGKKKLGSYSYDGFWQAMDTFKDKIAFDRMESSGNCPWKVWKK
jgi:glucose-1-phosphate cytidylyltransferase